jgi:hypothetical protein
MEHPNLRVRSKAVNMAVAGASVMLLLGAFRDVAAATLERVKEAVARALQRGLEPEQEELAKQFIAWDGQLRVVEEE